MAFKRPTLERLIRRARSDIATRLDGADANLRGTPEEALAIASAGLTHGEHGHLKWLSKQILPDQSEEAFVIRQADVHGIERNAAEASTGTATITGTNTTVCPAGTVWVRGDGVEYTQDANVTISGGEATIALTAVVPGTDGDAVAGVKLTISSGVAGINSTATVSGGGIIDGADIEDIEDLRTRLLEHLRTPPSGGGPGSYVAWAKEVDGVTRAWEVANLLGPGTVGVYFVRDNDVSMIPDAGEVSDVQDYIDTLAPITADVTVIAPTASAQAFTFTALDPNTTDVQDAIEAELEQLFLDIADPSQITTIPISKIREAISVATGEEDYTMTVPSADITVPAGTIKTVGVITWPV